MNAFKRVHLPNDFRMFQMLYAVRFIWWTIGASFGLDFALPYLDHLRHPASIVLMGVAGLAGAIAAWTQWYYVSYVFHICGVYFFAMVSYSFFLNNIHSVAGPNYFLEMLGLVWLTFRVRSFPFYEPKPSFRETLG